MELMALSLQQFLYYPAKATFDSNNTGPAAGSIIVGEPAPRSPAGQPRVPTKPTKQTTLRLVEEIACGLSYLHGNGLLHRDIKPANVLLTADLQAKLADFGVATRFGMEHTTGTGTPRYMAPEVLLGKYDESADVYSLALLIWEIMHQAVPFADANAFTAALQASLGQRPQCDTPRSCSRVQAQLIEACWHADPRQRPVVARVWELSGLIRKAEVPGTTQSLATASEPTRFHSDSIRLDSTFVTQRA